MRRSLYAAALAAILTLPFAALAADDPAPAAPPAAAPKVTLTLGLDQLNVIAKGLAELPLKEAAPVLNEIQQQVNKELAPAAPSAKKR